MKQLLPIIAAIIALTSFTTFAQIQKKIIRSGDDQELTLHDDNLVDIRELAVFITQEGDEISVTNMMDVDARPKGYEDIDIQLGDIVMMMNGKRLTAVSDLGKFYKEAKVGETIKLGIKRGEKMLIISFDKVDPEKLPKRKMIIRRSGDGEEQDILGIPQVGLIIGTKGKDLLITDVLDNAKKELNNADVKEGDKILKLNGEPVSSFQDFSKKYEKLGIGDKVELQTSRSKKNQTITFKKPERKGGMKIIKKSIGD